MRVNLHSLSFTVLFSMLFFNMAFGATGGTVITVAQDNSGNFKTIQAAINSVSASNSSNVTIFIKNGTYEEHLVIDKSFISLVGEDRAKTIIRFSIEREAWNKTNGSTAGCAVINIGCSTDYKKMSSGVTDIVIANCTVENSFDSSAVKTMVIKDESNSNRVWVVNCNIWCKGHDTISLWNKPDGMYYHADCSFKGSVDAVCPRGWCYAVGCEFLQTRSGCAPLWHEVAAGTTQKFVVRTGTFQLAPGASGNFKLLNQNNSGGLGTRFFVLDGVLASQVNTKGTSSEAYFWNCHGGSGDTSWFKDNLSSATGSPVQSQINAKWAFDGKWDPENTMPAVLPFAALPQPWNKAYDVATNVQLKWAKARNADKYALYFGTAANPPFVKIQSENVYVPGVLASGKYYWKVNAIAGSDTIAGAVWTFSTGNGTSLETGHIVNTKNPELLVRQNGSTSITFSCFLSGSGPTALSLYTVAGKQILSFPELVRGPGIYTEQYDFAENSLPTGTYIARLYQGNVAGNAKFIVP